MSSVKIYLELPYEVEAVFADNQISIAQLLSDGDIEGIERVERGVLPYDQKDGATNKDMVTIIIAGAAALGAITLAITSVLNTIYKKPYLVQYDEVVELRDKDGNVVKDKKGNPIFKTVKTSNLVEPRKENKKIEIETSFSLTKGIVLKILNEEIEIDIKEK